MARKACNDRSIELIYAGTDITYDEVDRKEQIGASGARRVGEGRPVRSYSEGLSPSPSLRLPAFLPSHYASSINSMLVGDDDSPATRVRPTNPPEPLPHTSAELSRFSP